MSLKVLIVEDDEASLELLSEVLSSLDAQVRPVSDSQQAAAIVNREKFDGIFLALEMPKLHGFELTRLVRESSWNKSTPIVIVTGREARDTMQRAFAVGATFFLQKPIDRQKVTQLFRTVRGTMFENRRRFVRVPLQTEVSCEIGTRTVRGMSWNISQGGILFEAVGLRPGDTVRLSFPLPGAGITINTPGVVVRRDERQRVGVQFTGISTEHQGRIRQFIDEVAD